MSDDDVMTPEQIEAYKREYAHTMTKELVKLMATEGGKFGHEFEMGLALDLFNSVLATMLYRKLKHDSDLPNANYQAAKKKYLHFKSQVQHGIAMAFQKAFEEYGGQSMEYYCQILPVKEPINKFPC